MHDMKTRIVREIGGEKRHFMVSTCCTLDAGWETLVFACNSRGFITEWGELYGDRYSGWLEAAAGHDAVVSGWKYAIV